MKEQTDLLCQQVEISNNNNNNKIFPIYRNTHKHKSQITLFDSRLEKVTIANYLPFALLL